MERSSPVRVGCRRKIAWRSGHAGRGESRCGGQHMAQKAQELFLWDVTVTLEALGAAEVVLWNWEPERDRLHLTGAAHGLGLSPILPECSSPAALALALPQDRA